MFPIIPAAALPVANGIVLMSWMPSVQLTPFELAFAAAEFVLGIAAVAVLRSLKDRLPRRPVFYAKHWAPADRHLWKAA
jgi:hypothetical protein